MVRVGRSGDDEETLNELVNRAKARNRFAEGFVSYPGQDFWVSLIRRILLTKVYAGKGGALLRTRPGAIFAQAFRAAGQEEGGAAEEQVLLRPEDFIRGAEPFVPAAIVPLRLATIDLMATSRARISDEAVVAIVLHELQVAVADALRLRSDANQFDIDVTDRVGVRDIATVAVVDNSLFVAVQDGVRAGGTAEGILTLIVNQSTGIPFTTVGYLLNMVPDLVVSRSDFLRVAAAAAARADLQVNVTDAPGLRFRAATTPSVVLTLMVSEEDRLRVAATASVRPVLNVLGESRLAVAADALGPRLEIFLSAQDALRAATAVEYIDVVDMPTLEVLSSTGLRLGATSSQEAGARPEISASASSGLRASAAFGGALRSTPLIQILASSGLRIAATPTVAFGARPNISIIESDGVRSVSAFPAVIPGPLPTIDIPTVQDALRVAAAAPALQLSARQALAVSETEALRLASTRAVTAGPRPNLLVSESESLRIRSQAPTVLSGIRPTLTRSVSTALRARSRAPDDRTVALGPAPWFPPGGEFETYPPGWLLYEAGASAQIVAGGVSGNCAVLRNSVPLSYEIFYTVVTIPQTGTWRMYWYGKRGASTSVYVSYVFRRNTTPVSGEMIDITLRYGAGFLQYYVDAAFTAGQTAFVGVGGYGGLTNQPACYVDSVQLVKL